jgi:hypothetical protein
MVAALTLILIRLFNHNPDHAGSQHAECASRT